MEKLSTADIGIDEVAICILLISILMKQLFNADINIDINEKIISAADIDIDEETISTVNKL